MCVHEPQVCREVYLSPADPFLWLQVQALVLITPSPQLPGGCEPTVTVQSSLHVDWPLVVHPPCPPFPLFLYLPPLLLKLFCSPSHTSLSHVYYPFLYCFFHCHPQNSKILSAVAAQVSVQRILPYVTQNSS